MIGLAGHTPSSSVGLNPITTEEMHMLTRLSRSIRAHERGATAVEYVFMAALIALVIFGAVTTLGQVVSGLFTSVLPGI